MNREQKQTPNIVGMISAEEHELLANRNEDDPRLQELRARLGDSAGTAVAILMSAGDGTDARYIVVNGDDSGTVIRDHERHGLPDPLSAASEIAQQEGEVSGEHQDGLAKVRGSLIEKLEEAKPFLEYIDTAIATDRSIMYVMDSLTDEWKHMIYGGTTPSDDAVMNILSQVHMLKGRVQEEQVMTSNKIEELRPIDSTLEDMSKSPELKDDPEPYERDKIFKAIRVVQESFNEAQLSMRNVSAREDETIQLLDNLARQLSQLMSENWGKEVYISTSTQILGALTSEPSLLRQGMLLRTQAEFENLLTLQAKLVDQTW